MTLYGFNPSFLLDGLGINIQIRPAAAEDGFNPSFLLDGLGILTVGKRRCSWCLVSILVSYWMGWE